MPVIGDTPSMIRTRKFLAPYDSLLARLGCPKFSQPEAPAPRASTEATQVSLGPMMNALRINNEFTDVVLEAEGERLSAHKTVLAANSKFFKARFSEQWDRNHDRVITFEEPICTLSIMLDFAYEGEYDAPILEDPEDPEEIADRLDEILDTLSFADRWDMLPLRDQVEDFLTETANATLYRRAVNVDSIRERALQANAMRVVQDCDRYITMNREGMARMSEA